MPALEVIIHEAPERQQEISSRKPISPLIDRHFPCYTLFMKTLTISLLLVFTLAGPSFAQDDEGATPIETAVEEGQLPAQLEIAPNITGSLEFQAVQEQVLQDPGMISDIEKLLDDPEIMGLLSNPNFLAAIQSGNITALQSDPNLQRLSENPKIQALINKIKSQQ